MRTVLSVLLLFLFFSAQAELENFDKLTAGDLGSPWVAGVTGRGQAQCTVTKFENAFSKPNVLKQSKEGTFPYCVRKDVSFADGSVESRIMPISGNEDQAGGLVWRFKDGDNYYLARINALENNVSLFYVEAGKRKTIKYTDAPVAKDQWHLLKVEFKGARIKIIYDGKNCIELDDDHIATAGAVGVWTKADSITAFDDFNYQSDDKVVPPTTSAKPKKQKEKKK